ncbi:MAG: amidohydrolase family protein [Xanthomonadaceae bacterium]|nr:amidohydrolase family protein [Xanthomonadaceae bacterium]
MRLLIIALALVSAAGTAAAADVLVIRAERVILDAAAGHHGPAQIVVRDGRIAEVLPYDGQFQRQDGERLAMHEFDAAFTVLPGLIDSHVHLTGDPGRQWWEAAVTTPEYGTAVGIKNAALTVRAGFTTVRDLGSSGMSGQAVRDAIDAGLAIGPRVLAAGKSISIIGGHADVSGFRPEVTEALSTGACTGAVECAARVRELSRAGADVIKFTATGGVLSQQNRGFGAHFTDEEMRAIVETAHTLGLRVAAHAHGARGVEAAARAGVDSIEHGTFVDDAAIKAIKASGAYLVPTLGPTIAYRERVGTGVYTPVVEEKIRIRLDATGKNIQAAHKAGIPIAFGTDAGVYDHGRNAEEFPLMIRYGGLSAQQALVSATRTAAELLGIAEETGTLEPGKAADVIVVNGDPLADITTLQRVELVLARGRVVSAP